MSQEKRGREVKDECTLTLGEGDNLGVEGKTARLLPSRTQECKCGRIPVCVFFTCECVFVPDRNP